MSESPLRHRLVLLVTALLAFAAFSVGSALAATWEFNPKEEVVFTEVGQEKAVTLTNLSGSPIKITWVTVGSEALYVPAKSCQGAVLGKCTETVKCVKSGNAYLTFHPHPETPAPSASILMTC